MKIALVTLCSLAALVLLIEGGGRFVIWFLYHVPGKSHGIYRTDPVLDVRLRENSYNTTREFNNRGFQTTEDSAVPKPTDIVRVITYGGSTTFCYNLPMPETWPLQLQAVLRERGIGRAEVLNAGDVAMPLAYLYARSRTELGELQPDFVVIYSGLNEMYNAFGLRAEGVDLAAEIEAGKTGLFHTHGGQFDFMPRNSIAYKVWFAWVYYPYIQPVIEFAAETFGVAATPSGYEGISVDIVQEHYNATLTAFVSHVISVGATPVFIVQVGDLSRPNIPLYTRFSREGADIARKAGAIVVDGRRILDDRSLPLDMVFAESGVHLTAAGARLFASFLADSVDWSARGETAYQ